MFRIYLVFSLIVFIAIKEQCYAQKVVFNWGTQQANLNYKQCYQSLTKLNLGEAKTKELTDCVFGKMKAKFPKGINLNTNQFMDLTKQLMQNCFEGQSIQTELPFFWNEEFLKGFRTEMKKSMPSEFSEDQKNKLIECVLIKLKQKYPKGGFKISEIQKEYREIAEDCQSEIIK